MGEIKVNDRLISPSGNTTKVNKIHPQGKIKVLKIKFQDGREVKCSEEHLWDCWISENNRRKLRTTKEIYRIYKKTKQKVIIPLTEQINYRNINHKLDPYLIGVLLGDGCIRQNITLTSGDIQIVDLLKKKIPKEANINKLKSKYSYSITYTKHNKKGYLYNPITDELRRLNLMGLDSSNKFIPTEYKKGLIKQRLDIVRGLLDTDGTVCKKGKITFISKSERLADDLREILFSLGARVTKSVKNKKFKGELFGPFYELYINIKNKKQLFLLDRKYNRCREFNGGKSEIGNRIINIDYIGDQVCQCITIDKEDGLYLTDNYIVTHNSYIGCWKGLLLNLKYPGNRGLICRKENTSLKQTTLFTLFTQVLPKEWIISHNKTDGKIVHATPIKGVYSTIIYGGLDKSEKNDYPTKIGGASYGWVFADETLELEKADWGMLNTRLDYKIPRYTENQNDRIPRQIFGATNPDSPKHWLYKFFFECTKEERKEREVYLMTPYENTYLPKSYIKHQESTLSGIQRERLLLGKWVGAEGLIYKSFDINKHIVDESELLNEINQDGSKSFNIRLYKQVIFAADSNFPIPRAAVLIGLHGEGRVDIIDEFYMENAHIQELIKWLLVWKEKIGKALTGYHDPSAPDEIDTINNTPGLICEKANNQVIPGISEVSRYFDNDLIRINKTCTNTIKEFQSYKWKKGGEGIAPNKVDDHLCFIAGTKILTLYGEKNIEKIKSKDYVLTRKGWKKVNTAKITDYTSEVYQVNFSDGRKLICTGNHPIWIKGKGFRKADSLRYFYIVVDSLRYLWKTKYLMEGVIIKAKMDIGEEGVDSTIYTETYGNIIMERFQKAITYIIKMAIKTTMNYQISNVYQLRNIIYFIQSKIKKKLENILKKLDHSQKNGIEVKKDINGIQNIGKKVLEKLLKKENIFVFNAVRNLLQELYKELNSVIQTANKKLYVLDVKKLKKKRIVYNLSVEGCHEYFANGILVSNCDSLRYGLNSIKQIRKPTKFRAIY